MVGSGTKIMPAAIGSKLLYFDRRRETSCLIRAFYFERCFGPLFGPHRRSKTVIRSVPRPRRRAVVGSGTTAKTFPTAPVLPSMTNNCKPGVPP